MDKPHILEDIYKVSAIRDLLTIQNRLGHNTKNSSSQKKYAEFIGVIRDLLDDKMTMTEVDDYIKRTLEPDN